MTLCILLESKERDEMVNYVVAMACKVIWCRFIAFSLIPYNFIQLHTLILRWFSFEVGYKSNCACDRLVHPASRHQVVILLRPLGCGYSVNEIALLAKLENIWPDLIQMLTNFEIRPYQICRIFVNIGQHLANIWNIGSTLATYILTKLIQHISSQFAKTLRSERCQMAEAL